ncbi:hypothetical protein IMCC3088_869 [Aequoribacter fuscus]|uniref:Uncharacterized protein n=1 Tax=Aequoribacter fuscus TaxID=2518989 RepID=F3L0E8_9GAMM|nr:hypothetical protein IMCC3088_869 [Aequoribacter fuscus]
MVRVGQGVGLIHRLWHSMVLASVLLAWLGRGLAKTLLV